MRMLLTLLLVAAFALSPLAGVPGEKQLVDIKELAGTWQGVLTREQGQEHATMILYSRRQAAISLVTNDRDRLSR